MKYSSLYQTKAVYPQDIQCVLQPHNKKGGIFIGNLEASQNLQTLKKHGIKSILTAAKGIKTNHPKYDIPYYLYVPAEDHEKFDLSEYFEKSVQFISCSLKDTNILVHCMAGISRSVTLVLAYLMKCHNYSLEEAYNKVKTKRKIINPNNGFIKQLKNYQKQINSKNQVLRRSYDNFYQNKNKINFQGNQKNGDKRLALHQSGIRNINTSFNSYDNLQYLNKQSFLNLNMRQDKKVRYENSNFYSSQMNLNKNKSYDYDINKQLDQKIASIRKKYMEATDLLNYHGKRENRKNQKHQIDRASRTISNYGLKMKYSNPSRINLTTNQFANRLSNTGNQSYMYYQYNF